MPEGTGVKGGGGLCPAPQQLMLVLPEKRWDISFTQIPNIDIEPLTRRIN